MGMDGLQRSLGPDGGMLQAIAACIAGWLAAGVLRADLELLRQALGILFNF
jgi:hypothetical protein